jgi:hypothetical protein
MIEWEAPDAAMVARIRTALRWWLRRVNQRDRARGLT